MVEKMQKLLNSRHEFMYRIKEAVFVGNDCEAKVDRYIAELIGLGVGEQGFHDEINNALRGVAVASSSFRAEGETEYKTISKNILYTLGRLFEASGKDEKTAEAITEGLRYWQINEIESALRNYRDMTRTRR
ncbi:MAG: hypothetical protein M1544_03500 [Candidatus Marsarchaeota archaeon]|nr:hypothetical protein [Candidatus Marsarchaeota archaeon]